MLKKLAQGPSWWSQALEKLKRIGLRPEIVAMLNSVDQIVWEQSSPPDNPNAVAYVSSEDKNNNGKIDKIHFVLSKFPPSASEDEINSIVEMVAKTLVHEYGHIEDFDEENGFPGGEAVAESAERQSEPVIQSGLTALTALNVFKGRGLNMFKELQKLANHLDEIGEVEFADTLDGILLKSAGNVSRDALADSGYAQMSMTNLVKKFEPEIAIARKDPRFFTEAKDYATLKSTVGNMNRSVIEAFDDFRSGSRLGGILEDILAYKISGTPLPWAKAQAEREEKAQPMAKATKISSGIIRIQNIVGTKPDGLWGPNTKGAVRVFLLKHSKHLIPSGQAGADKAMKGWWAVGVEGTSVAGKYTKTWGGLADLLTDLESKREEVMMTSQDATRAPDAAYGTPRAETSNAMDDVVSGLSSEFSLGLPKFNR
jgi:hypothetical protein